MTATSEQASTEARAERVHVVDDDPSVLKVVSRYLETAGVSAVCHSSAAEFLSALHPEEFGCAVIDMVLPGVDRFTLLRKLVEDYPCIQVIMMSGYGDIPDAVEAVRYGAVDFLEKPLRRERLTGLVLRALEVARARHAKVSSRQEIRRRLAKLTPREIQLLPMFCSGMSVKDIARELGLSNKTVQVHRARMLDRMRVDSVVELSNLLHDIDWDGKGDPEATNRDLG